MPTSRAADDVVDNAVESVNRHVSKRVKGAYGRPVSPCSPGRVTRSGLGSVTGRGLSEGSASAFG
jgi:hypothetical protein